MKRILLLTFLIMVFAFSSISYANEIYDVILFWGQSNMVGSSGIFDEEALPQYYDHNDPDQRLAFSLQTGIDLDIIENDVALNHVTAPMESGVALEYKELSNSFEDIKDRYILGEDLYFDENNNKLISGFWSVENGNNVYNYSIQKSYGTNMIPWFCKTYYEKTGHKIVVVFAACGGCEITCFLPATDSEHSTTNPAHLVYEAIREKYKNAINCMKSNNMKVGKKLFVAYQGETDFMSATDPYDYIYRFQRVINNLKQDLDIRQGAIVETGGWVNNNQNSNFTSFLSINNAQKTVAYNNEGVIIASTYPFEHTLPADESTYNSDSFTSSFFNNWTGGKPSYNTAIEFVYKTRGLPTGLIGGTTSTHNNQVHLSSAALSQVGKEVATSISYRLDLKYDEPTTLMGDMDGDGRITIIDVRLLLQEFINNP